MPFEHVLRQLQARDVLEQVFTLYRGAVADIRAVGVFEILELYGASASAPLAERAEATDALAEENFCHTSTIDTTSPCRVQ